LTGGAGSTAPPRVAAVLLTVPVVVVSLFTLAALLEAIWAVAACAVARFVGGGGSKRCRWCWRWTASGRTEVRATAASGSALYYIMKQEGQVRVSLAE